MKGLLTDKDNDLVIQVKRDGKGKIVSGLQLGNTELQDAYMVLSLNQGDLKEDPIAGVNLTSLIRGRKDREQIKNTIKIGMRRCGIDWEEVKELIRIEGVEL